MYITYLEYTQLGKHPLPEFEFTQKEYEAERIVDDLTTGVDGICKLQTAFPEEGKDRRAVIMCMVALIELMADVDDAKQQMRDNDNGGIITAKSSGSESITYAKSYVAEYIKGATSETDKRNMLRNTARFWLYGIRDANGVNLLYGGDYNV